MAFKLYVDLHYDNADKHVNALTPNRYHSPVVYSVTFVVDGKHLTD